MYGILCQTQPQKRDAANNLGLEPIDMETFSRAEVRGGVGHLRSNISPSGECFTTLGVLYHLPGCDDLSVRPFFAFLGKMYRRNFHTSESHPVPTHGLEVF
jgi:hypothetical protein